MGRGIRKVHDFNPFADEPTFMTSRDMIRLCKLNRQGLNMLEYLMREGNVYKGKFLIPCEEYLKEMKQTAKKSFYLGIDNLILWELIAKSKEVNFYYINTKFFPDVKP